jgi:hypothetical protein
METENLPPWPGIDRAAYYRELATKLRELPETGQSADMRVLAAQYDRMAVRALPKP